MLRETAGGIGLSDIPAVTSDKIAAERLKEIMNENKGLLNKSVAQYERISEILIVEKEFEKTPKKSINGSCTRRRSNLIRSS